MEFKRQTNRSTRQDNTTNINLFLKDFSFGVVTSKYWGNFTESRKENPLIEIDLDGKSYQIELIELKRILRKSLTKEDLKNYLN
jgi:hypothetical protein